jgi:hypothetical protein
MKSDKESFKEKTKSFFKRSYLVLLYHLRGLWKNIFRLWPLLLFSLSIFLFLIVLIPNFEHRYPLLGEWPLMLELDGRLLSEVNESNVTKFEGVNGAKVEIGGYTTFTDSEGKFKIKFMSNSLKDLPVLIEISNKTIINRISFEENQFKRDETFYLK